MPITAQLIIPDEVLASNDGQTRQALANVIGIDDPATASDEDWRNALLTFLQRHLEQAVYERVSELRIANIDREIF